MRNVTQILLRAPLRRYVLPSSDVAVPNTSCSCGRVSMFVVSCLPCPSCVSMYANCSHYNDNCFMKSLYQQSVRAVISRNCCCSGHKTWMAQNAFSRTCYSAVLRNNCSTKRAA